ncbi:MAG TPA: ATP-binding cassette domain-containing protein [Microbacterium sp.]|uniref:ATP-binding cassette domain-containing protein n=1 Tax=Microbacterium sp. TaxID=51671 RepID=UPI002B4A8FEA|nr:ATP-binding cassette domain-containing protein [Microbacterium sp.]HKT58172.1 ATP-binding cassette domain-containing protein [Microbacterium sp.]
MDVPAGEITVLLGANGAGKTTLLEAISGVIPFQEGTVSLGGERIDKLSRRRRSRMGLAHVEQGRTVFGDLTVEENVTAVARKSTAWRDTLALFPELEQRRHVRAGMLSGGEQQMLTVARALATEPTLVMVDEMSLGLAPLIVRRLMPVMRQLADEGVTVLMVEQFAGLALEVGDRAYVMRTGELAFDGTCAELLARRDMLHSAYLGSDKEGGRNDMATDGSARLPYRDLSSLPHGIEGCAWGTWGPDDEVGAFNDVGPTEVLGAVATVTEGAVFAVGWDLQQPSPALFGREQLVHNVRDDGFGMDDSYDRFFPQASSQWDSLAHFSHPVHHYYGGRTSDQLKGAGAKNGIDNLARRGIVGRFVLADIDRWRTQQGRPIDHAGGEVIGLGDLIACLDAQGVTLTKGDILLVRFGWIAWYEAQPIEVKTRLAAPDAAWSLKAAGLEPAPAVAEWLWDAGVVAVAADSPSFEAFPFDPLGESLHAQLLALLGIPIGEMWALDALAAHCSQDGRYAGLLASAPLNLAGGIGSTANAVAIK